MRNISWPTGDVLPVAVRATVGGRTVRVISVDGLTRDLPQTFPGQTSLTGGVAAATGSMTIGPDKDLTERVENPWSSTTYPQRGQRVNIWVSHGTTEVKIFTGRVDDVTGSTDDPEITIGLVDDFDQLTAFVSHTAMSRMMPPLSTLGDGFQRMTGLLSSWVTDFAARAAGFYATPPMDGYCLVSAPMQGSTWPERGNLRNSYRGDDVGIWHKYHPGAATEFDGWLTMSNLYCEYEPDQYNTPYNAGITTARPLNLTMMAGRSQASSSYVAARWANGYTLRIACGHQRGIFAQVVAPDGAITTVASIHQDDAKDWTTATARWRPSGSVSLTVEITTDTGWTTQGAVIPPSTSGVFTDPIYQIRVYAPEGCYIAGVQASFTSLSPASTWTRTFNHKPQTPLRNLWLIPGITKRPAVDLLQDQAEAEGSAVWIDEDGILQYRDRSSFLAGAVSKTVTSARDILSLKWELSSKDTHRSVSVKYRSPSVSISRRSSLVAYEGMTEELSAGDDHEIWIEPKADEEWILVDTTPRTIYGDYNYDKLNSGQGTFVGFTGMNSAGDEIPRIDGSVADWTLEFNRVGGRAWKYVAAITKLPSTVDRVITQTRKEDGSPIKKVYRGRGLPLARCMGKGAWSDQEESTGVVGPSWATDYDHDAKWFIQSAAEAKKLADDIAEETKSSTALLDQLPVRPDPRIQLGDRIRIQDPDVTGLSMDGVVYSVSQTISEDDHTMRLGVLVTSAQTPYATLDEFDQWYSGMTLDQLDSNLSGITLDQLDNHPLR